MKAKNVLKQLERIDKETRSFECPCCKAQLQFRVGVDVLSVSEAGSGSEAAMALARNEIELNASLLRDGKELLRKAKELGVFDAFNLAVDARPNDKPKDRDLHFVKWLARAVKQKVSQGHLRECLPENNRSGNLELFSWQGVSAILANGEFRVFIPKQLVWGESISVIAAATNGTINSSKPVDREFWVRTKFGYVDRSSEFAYELRKQSFGAFAVK